MREGALAQGHRLSVTIETMSPRLVTLECKADALEKKKVLNHVSADRHTNKRVKH